MRYLITAVLLFAIVGGALGAIGWCGQIWPNSGSEVPVGDDVTVYFQIWKDGFTPDSGRGDSIAATLYWRESGTVSWNEVVMTYLGDVGNNDEYSGDMPGLASPGTVEYYCEALDSTDMSTLTGQDQNLVDLNESSPGTLYFVDVTSIDVTVTFRVDMTLETVSGAVTVAGSWNSWDPEADTLTDPDMDDVFTGDILFPAGSNPGQSFKFVNGGTWESIPSDRSLTIDDSGPTQVLPIYYFGDNDPADYTDIPVEVHFRVDMSAETVSTPYVAGSVPPLTWGWDDGWSDTLMLYDDGAHDDLSSGDGIYGAMITFPSGSYKYVEYKYTTDGTDNEPLPAFENHSFEMGSVSPLVLPVDTFGILAGVAESELPKDFRIIAAPNPFNAKVGIDIDLPEAGELDIEIYDIRGRRAVTLQRGFLPAGRTHFEWDAAGRPSGIYFLRVYGPGRARTEKLLLVK